MYLWHCQRTSKCCLASPGGSETWDLQARFSEQEETVFHIFRWQRAYYSWCLFFFFSFFLFLTEKNTITSTYHTETVLDKVVQEMENQHPTTSTQNVLIHHDDASPHKTRAVIQYLDEQQVQIWPHPPYGPDLAQCGFWPFPLLKERLAVRQFSNVHDPSKIVHSEMKSIHKRDYHRAFADWLKRIPLCMQYKVN